jgi:glutathione-specific gamma-glutamylcyclotransferase
MGDLWIFGYGSLMWKPGFAYEESQLATLTGYRRSFCIYSVHHRGNAVRPGLVLGLDRGGVCRGVAFRVHGDRATKTLRYLREREQVHGVYREAHLSVSLEGAELPIQAVVFLAEKGHPSYTGNRSLVQQAHLIRAAKGLSGANLDYLINTLDHLGTLGLRERELERVLATAGSVFARGPGGPTRAARAVGLARVLQHGPVGAPTMKVSDRNRFTFRQS